MSDDNFVEKMKELYQIGPDGVKNELTSRLKQLQEQHDKAVNKSFTGADLNELEKVLDNIAEDKVTMKDVYIVEALMIKHL